MDIVFCALIDSGSSHCFIDSKFVSKYSILTKSIPPITLQLFDGSSNSTITYMISLPIQFPTGEFFDIDFYVTPLDHLCSAVLGYNWLTHYNPLIDWVLGSITFWTPVHSGLDSDMMSIPALAPPMPSPTPTHDSPVNPPTQTPNPSEPWIAFLDTVAFTRACKEEGTESFQIHISDPNSASRWSAKNPILWWTFPLSLQSIMTTLMSSANPRPTHYLLIGLMTSRSTLRREHLCLLVQSTPSLQQNSLHSANSSMSTSNPVSSILQILLTELWSFSSKKWTTLAMCRLLWSQSDHKERLLPASAYCWPVGHSSESLCVYKDWSPTRLPPHPHRRRWQTKNCLPDPLQILQVVCNAL